MKSLRTALLRINYSLLLLGIAGLAVYFLLVPRLHPDGGVQYLLSAEEALDRARGFAYNQGYDVQDMKWRTARVRHLRIIDTLEAQTSFREVREILKDTAFLRLPAYGWEIEGRKESADNDQTIEVSLSQTGAVWSFRTEGLDEVEPRREALLRVYRDRDIPDSVETQALVGRFWAIPISGRTPPPLPPDSARRPGFTSADAEAIAGYYFEKSLFSQYDMAVDSIIRSRGSNPNLVGVVYAGVEPASQVEVVSHFNITSSGVLRDIQTNYLPEIETEEESEDISITWGSEGIDDVLGFAMYAILAIFMFVLFLRRMHARLIDVKSAMQDAIWGGLFMMLLVGNSAGWQTIQESSRPLLGWLAALGMMAASGFVFAFATFIVTSATDSVARTIWPQKLETLTLARNARFVNRTIGLAFARAAMLAGIFLGLHTLFLYLPGISLNVDGRFVSNPSVISSLLGTFSYSGILVMLTSMMSMLGIGAIVYNKWRNKNLLIVVIALLGAALQLGAQTLDPSILQWIFSGTVGFIFVVAFLKYDYFSSFMGLLLYYVLWQMTSHWLVDGAQSTGELWFTFGLIPGVFVLGLVGLISDKKSDDVSRFMPAYVREHAQQERLKGELEIARQVQSSLLPRRMPSIQGADIAAMCLPAQEVGGDYFDFIRLDDHRLAVVIGDVSGKGIQAGFFMTLTKGFLHAICCDHDSPAEVLSRVNKLFCENVPRGTFISLIYGILDMEKQTFTFARAGHDPMLFLGASSDTSSFYKPSGMAIGLTASDLFRQTIENEEIELKAGDLLVFYTDGITEAVNPHMEQFGVDRLAHQVTRAGMQKSARQVLQEVSEHVQAFCQTAGRADDMTMVVLRIPSPQDSISKSSHAKQPALAE